MKWYVWLMAVSGVVLIVGGLLYLFVFQDTPKYSEDEVIAIVNNKVIDQKQSEEHIFVSLSCDGGYSGQGKWVGSGRFNGKVGSSWSIDGSYMGTTYREYNQPFLWNFYEKSGTIELRWQETYYLD